MTPTQLLKRYPDVDREVLARCEELIGSITRCELYCQSRTHGNDDKFAAICALRRTARGMTDDVALSGLDSMSAIHDRDPDMAKRLAREAAKRGYKVKPTDCYIPTMADALGDPAAFVNHGQGRSHVKKVLEQRGLESHGMVETKAREPEADPYTPVHKLSPKIVEQRRKQQIKANPELARVNQNELRANIIAKHGIQD